MFLLSECTSSLCIAALPARDKRRSGRELRKREYSLTRKRKESENTKSDRTGELGTVRSLVLFPFEFSLPSRFRAKEIFAFSLSVELSCYPGRRAGTTRSTRVSLPRRTVRLTGTPSRASRRA